MSTQQKHRPGLMRGVPHLGAGPKEASKEETVTPSKALLMTVQGRNQELWPAEWRKGSSKHRGKQRVRSRGRWGRSRSALLLCECTRKYICLSPPSLGST